ncbi:hypothetical protein LINPERPRIM_LOCUS25957 [Linum perenne]
MVTKEKDEELALFLELRRREKEKSNFLVSSNPLTSDAHIGIKGGISPATLLVPQRKTAAERFLDSENDKSDYDWLITPPRTPVLPSTEMDAQKSLMCQPGRNARPTALSSRLTNIQAETAPKTHGAYKPANIMTSSVGLNSSSAGNRRSSSTVRTRPASRPSTPTSRPTLPSPRMGRSSTPTARPALSSTKPSRSSTPTSTTQRPSTPTSRPSLPSSKSSSRPSTPPRRLSAPLSRSSSVTRSASVAYKTPVQSRGSSPTPAVKLRAPWNPDEMPGFSNEAPPNLRTSLADRPASATRGRPGARSSSSSSGAASNGRPRQQSSSPARRRSTVSNGSATAAPVSRMPISVKSISQIIDRDDLHQGMVERVGSMRRIAPPKQDDQRSSLSNSSGVSLSSSLDSTGSGRSLSKKSLDMALRHMPLMTNVPASSMYSVRSSGGGSTRSWTSGSPHGTSSNCSSSEPSVNNGYFADGMEAEENEFTSERRSSSPTSQASRW